MDVGFVLLHPREREYLRENYPELVQKINDMCDMCEFDLSLFKHSGRNHWVEDWLKEKELSDR